jgi:hypothetical protein
LSLWYAYVDLYKTNNNLTSSIRFRHAHR